MRVICVVVQSGLTTAANKTNIARRNIILIVFAVAKLAIMRLDSKRGDIVSKMGIVYTTKTVMVKRSANGNKVIRQEVLA